VNLRDYIDKNILVFDGAMGTMLQKVGMKAGELPEVLNILEKEKIIKIHKSYIDAGSKVITSNTFGANKIKLKNSGFTVEEIIHAGINNAKAAIEGKEIFIALDIGPIGELLEPMGTLTFEEAYEIFKAQVIEGEKSGADLILIETMTDLYEAKAAVLAAKENSHLPVFCTMSFEKSGRTFTGCNAASMVMVLQGLGVDALGINCSLGPKDIEPILDEILNISKVPVIVQVNAGLPRVSDGITVFDVSPKEFAAYGRSFVEKGLKIVGGCCGTTDEYIRHIARALEGINTTERQYKTISAVCTPSKKVLIDGVKIIGERINPTGKKSFKEALRKNDIDYILREAISQVEAGADILDVNIGLPDIDEEELIVKVIKEIQSILDVPLQIDSTNPRAIEKALRVYNGKAIVNSVNGDEKNLESILPIVKKYGAAVVGLTLDENGIPSTAEERFKIAEKIINAADSYGICKEDIYIDCLTLTAAAQQKEVRETLRAMTMIKERLGVKTVLGVSNVSFGLPNRELLNRTFLASALWAGLDLPIINPLDKAMMDTIRAFAVLTNQDKGAMEYLSNYGNAESSQVPSKGNLIDLNLYDVIVKGTKEAAKDLTGKLLTLKEPLEIVNESIIPALDFVGGKYEKGEIFLPQLIQAAEVVKASFEVIKEKLNHEEASSILKDKVLLATVKGDIHDIGKNIVKVLLENHGYEVIDLGKDVSKEKIIEAAIKEKVKLVGLSALMTTTVKSMEDTIKALKELYGSCKVMVGGAVLNEDYANSIGADFYAKDGKEAVTIAKTVLGE